jgi:hypothetical protein
LVTVPSPQHHQFSSVLVVNPSTSLCDQLLYSFILFLRSSRTYASRNSLSKQRLRSRFIPSSMNSKPNEEQCAELQCAELTNAETNFTTSATMTSLPIDVSSQAIESQPQCDGQECGVSQEKKMIKKKSQGGIQAHHPLHARPMTANDTSTTAPAMQAASPAASSTSRKCDRALSNTKPNEEKDTIPRYMGGLMFPMKLHLMLERCESERSKRKINASTTNASKRQKTGKDENQNMDKDNIIIGWLPSGNAFKIYDEERFVREIMPSYFSGSSQPQEQCSFEDFQRSLNLW